MSERRQFIRDIEKYSIAIRRCYKDINNTLDSLKENFDELFSRFDKHFGKNTKS